MLDRILLKHPLSPLAAQTYFSFEVSLSQFNLTSSFFSKRKTDFQKYDIMAFLGKGEKNLKKNNSSTQLHTCTNCLKIHKEKRHVIMLPKIKYYAQVQFQVRSCKHCFYIQLILKQERGIKMIIHLTAAAQSDTTVIFYYDNL